MLRGGYYPPPSQQAVYAPAHCYAICIHFVGKNPGKNSCRCKICLRGVNILFPLLVNHGSWRNMVSHFGCAPMRCVLNFSTFFRESCEHIHLKFQNYLQYEVFNLILLNINATLFFTSVSFKYDIYLFIMFIVYYELCITIRRRKNILK